MKMMLGGHDGGLHTMFMEIELRLALSSVGVAGVSAAMAMMLAERLRRDHPEWWAGVCAMMEGATELPALARIIVEKYPLVMCHEDE